MTDKAKQAHDNQEALGHAGHLLPVIISAFLEKNKK